jgi:type IV secretory system conjugative DNA transfer VirD4/TraG family protein
MRDKLWKKTEYPLRNVGLGVQGNVLLSEEERADHLHILGTTGEGKSRFIEHLIRGDIKQGNGVCLLDPTDRAETAYNILRYCQSISFKKVCLIDPHTIHLNRITCLQPFHYQKSLRTASVAGLMDTVRVLFQTRDASDTPRIQRYLSALLHVLIAAEMTLHEAIYFTDFHNGTYSRRRNFILDQIDDLNRHKITLESVFRDFTKWQMYFSSSINRLEPYFDSTLDLMYGADTGIDFIKMITEGWVILVNLYSGLGFEPIHSRLLGTTVINEIIFALDRLRNRGWKGVYYLYVDEAGRYANRNLADLLAYKRKSGLRVTVAHQYFSQFDDKYVLDAIKNLCKIKVMFNTPDPDDRKIMIKSLGYGGMIPPDLATYANKDLPKKTAIIKIGKTDPQRFQVPEVPDIKIKKKDQDEFVLKLLTNDWNKSPKQVESQFEQRFSSLPSKPGARTNSSASSNPVWHNPTSSSKAPPKNGGRGASKKS